MNRLILAIFVVIITAQTGFAQGPPTYADSPIFLGLEGRGLRTFGKYVSKENAKVLIIPVAAPYNIRTNMQIGGVVPVLRTSPEGIDSKTGIGDVSVFVKYLILQQDRIAKTFRVALKLQETFPTGNYKSAPPLGIGAYQTYIGLVSGYISTKFGVYTEIGYNAVFKDFNDNVIYNIAFGYPFLPVSYPPRQINFYLGLNGSSALKEKQNALFFSPSVQIIPSKRYLIEGGVQIPINESDSEKTNVIFTLGTRVLIF